MAFTRLVPLVLACLLGLSIAYGVLHTSSNTQGIQDTKRQLAQTQRALAASQQALVVARADLQLENAATRSVAYQTCGSVERLQAVIRTQVQIALYTLGKRGAPGYQYYRQHPDELAKGVLQLRDELAAFSRPAC